ncbi:MAG: lantibiotic dehydratase [Vulcanimicrobiaceae bacterium]
MASRATPFGLCAGIGEVSIGESTSLRCSDDTVEQRTWTRPDMELMLNLADEIEHSELRRFVRYATNGCVVERGGRLFVTNIALASQSFANGMPLAQQRPVALKNTEAVSFVREKCRNGSTFEDIVEALKTRFSAEEHNAVRLVEQLVSAGVIISEFRISPVGDPVATLLERFAALGAPVSDALRAAIADADALDRTPLRDRTRQSYAAVRDRFAALSLKDSPYAVQVDLRVPLSGTMHARILAEVERFADFCVRSAPVTTLQKMHQSFQERYEGTERLVPLLELIDENTGIGVPESVSSQERDTSVRDALLLQWSCEAMRAGTEEVVLDERTFDLLAPQLGEDDRIFPSIEIGFTIAARSREAIDAGDFLIAPGGYSQSDTSVKSLGRLAHMLPADIIERARKLIAREVPPQNVNAEFVFPLRERRSYNVAIRPALCENEIHVGIGSVAGNTLALDDLWVGIDDNRFYLWSVSQARRVSVRETHAFATAMQAPDLCRFLSLLRYDGRRVLNEFDWGPVAKSVYLPRVRIGRLVLSARRWLFPMESFDLQRARSDWNLPRFVQLVQEDRRLLIDLASPIAADLIADQMQGKESYVELYEALPIPDDAWLCGNDGIHLCEFVAEGISTRLHQDHEGELPDPMIVRDRVAFGPGSSWIYMKVYLGKIVANMVLLDAFAPLIAELKAAGAIDRWFFVRYTDPAFHLRVRLHAVNDQAADHVRAQAVAVTRSLLACGIVDRITFDTYQPEYERYGGATELAAIETLFTIDSDRVLASLQPGARGIDALVAQAAKAMNAHLLDADGTALVMSAFRHIGKGKLRPEDRLALREIASDAGNVRPREILDAAQAAKAPERRLADLMHMHCNRLGIETVDEPRVYALLRALALARSAQKKTRESIEIDSRVALMD